MTNYLTAGAMNPNQNNNQTEGIRTPKHKTIILNTKHPQKVRIIPYIDRPFAFPYRVCWVDVHNRDHTKTFPMMLTFTMNNHHDDKLRDLISQIVHINYSIRDKNPNITNDTIELQYKHPGKPHFPTTMQPTYALQVIPIVRGADGKDVMKTIQGSNIPEVHVMNVRKSVYTTIYNSIITDDNNELASWLNAKTHKPFPKDGTKPYMARWINVTNSFPVYIHRPNQPSARYEVQPQPMDVLPALPKELYAKDSNGKYKYLDDPAWMYEPTKTRQPDLYKIAYKDIAQRLDEYKESGQSNPYKDQIDTVKKNTQSSSDNTPKQSASSESNNDPFASQSTGSSASSVPFDTSSSDSSSVSSSSTSVSSGSLNKSVSSSSDSSEDSSSSDDQSSSSSDGGIDTDAILKDVLK